MKQNRKRQRDLKLKMKNLTWDGWHPDRRSLQIMKNAYLDYPNLHERINWRGGNQPK